MNRNCEVRKEKIWFEEEKCYEYVFLDVIRAYKSLAAEKSALEESMKALNVSEDANESQQESLVGEDQKEPKENNGTESEGGKIAKNDDDAIERASVGSSVDTSFSENASSVDAFSKPTGIPQSDSGGSKIAVLRRALATITEEKSRQEKAFTADRKNLLVSVWNFGLLWPGFRDQSLLFSKKSLH